MFIFSRTDGFGKLATKLRPDGSALSQDAKEITNNSVRRPYRGIEIKKDTYAALSIRKASGAPIPLMSSSARPSSPDDLADPGLVEDYSDFILQSVSDERVEKSQIVETFGDTFVYFFGERPRIVRVSGLLINTYDFNWRSQFWHNYDNHLRGSKLVEKNARAYLAYDTMVLEGYPMSASATDDTNMPYAVPFTMSLLLTNYFDYSEIGTTRTRNVPKDLQEVNDKLAQDRGKFTSTSAKVRSKNLQAQGGGGLFGALRKGIRTINEVTSTIGSGFDQLNGLIGGRVVRLPLGVAGYLASVGNATFAAGSVPLEGTQQFDAVTGELTTVEGSVKVRAPSAAQYAPLGEWKGYYWENYDEFTAGDTAPSLQQLVDPKTYSAWRLRRGHRAARPEFINGRLGIWTAKAEAGAILDTVATAVRFTKSAAGMIMTAKAYADNPENLARGWIGAPATSIDKQKTVKEGSIIERTKFSQTSNYVGSVDRTDTTYDLVAEDLTGLIPDDPDSPDGPAEIGSVYEMASYNPPVDQDQDGAEDEQGEDTVYELVYGSQDYTALVEADPTTEDSLNEVFGNNDAAPDGSDIDPDSFDGVYGLAAGQDIASTEEEVLERLTEAQSGLKSTYEVAAEFTESNRGAAAVAAFSAPEPSVYEVAATGINPAGTEETAEGGSGGRTEAEFKSTYELASGDTKGIRGVGEDDAQIDPVI